MQKQGHNLEIGTNVSISYGGTLSRKEMGLWRITCLDPKFNSQTVGTLNLWTVQVIMGGT